ALLARAYGIPPRPPAPPSAPVRDCLPCAEDRVAQVRDVASLASIAKITPAPAPTAASPLANLERLVAATVPGGVDFDGAASAATLSAPGSYTMFGRPADKNAAAVAVQTGRALDISA